VPTYQHVAVYAELGGSLRLAANTRFTVSDPATSLPVDITQGAVTGPYGVTDASGRADFTSAHPGRLRLTVGPTFIDVWPIESAGPSDSQVAGYLGSPTATRTAADARYVQTTATQPVNRGGTGSTTAAAARTALGVDGALRASDGTQRRVVAGVIRNTGSGWALITDADHQSTNVGSVTYSAANGGEIVINYPGISATKVVSFVVTPDETLARAGIFAGASVTQSAATIRLSRQWPEYADYVHYDGTNWVSFNGVFTPSFSAGVLTLTHPTLALGTDTTPQINVSVAGRGGGNVPNVGNSALSPTAFTVEFRDWAGALITTPSTALRAYVKRGGGLRSVDPAVIDTTAFPASNLWFMGIFEAA
jgi:hypothetical protein